MLYFAGVKDKIEFTEEYQFTFCGFFLINYTNPHVFTFTY